MNNERPRAATGPAAAGTFDDVVVPHLDAAGRLARWLMRNEHDAEDVVQEASLRAFKYLHTFHGGSGRAWFLRIVRNTCYSWRDRKVDGQTDPFDEERHSAGRAALDPEGLLLRTDDAALVADALSSLPGHLHQVLVLRELEGLSYRQLADVIGVPIGTVMSRLSRGREALRGVLDDEVTSTGTPAPTRWQEQEADAELVSSHSGPRPALHPACDPRPPSSSVAVARSRRARRVARTARRNNRRVHSVCTGDMPCIRCAQSEEWA
jgi:RNA polymerase sigma-70 factor, ECF subfamily